MVCGWWRVVGGARSVVRAVGYVAQGRRWAARGVWRVWCGAVLCGVARRGAMGWGLGGAERRGWRGRLCVFESVWGGR